MKRLGRDFLLLVRRPQGQCVSCGRHPPWPHVASCPYCSEEIQMPRAWVFLRRVWIAAFTGALGLVILLPAMYAGTAMLSQPHASSSVQGWILLSIATMLFLLPHGAHDVIICYHRELRTWQFKSLLGSLLIGTGALIGAIQLNATRWEWSVAVVCGVIMLCLVTAPYFFRLSAWRIWVGTALVFLSRSV